MELLLIRHGLPVRRQVTDGPADPGLSDEGHAQARLLGNYLAPERLDAVYASPLRRAVETAAPLADALGVSVVVDDGLAEFDRLAESYIPLEELKAEHGSLWRDRLEEVRANAPESPAEFRGRVVGCVEALVDAHGGQRIALVCHGGVINAYVAHVIGLQIDREFFLPNYTSIHRVMAARSGERSLGSLNEIAHLRGTGARAGLLN